METKYLDKLIEHCIKTNNTLKNIIKENRNLNESVNERNDELELLKENVVKEILNELVLPVEPSMAYEGNKLNYDEIYTKAEKYIIGMVESNKVVYDWAWIAKKIGYKLQTLNEDDIRLINNAIENAIFDVIYSDKD